MRMSEHNAGEPLHGLNEQLQSTYIDTYAKVAQAKLYKTKTPITVTFPP